MSAQCAVGNLDQFLTILKNFDKVMSGSRIAIKPTPQHQPRRGAFMNIKELTASISEAENIAAGKVRRITKAIIDRMGDAIDNGEKLQLPGLIFTPRTLPAREADGEKPYRPERKMAVLRRRVRKADKDLEEGN